MKPFIIFDFLLDPFKVLNLFFICRIFFKILGGVGCGACLCGCPASWWWCWRSTPGSTRARAATMVRPEIRGNPGSIPPSSVLYPQKIPGWVLTTEYTQSSNGVQMYIPSWWKSQPWLVRMEGARPPPFTLFNITYKVAVYAPAERACTLCFIYFISTLSVLCGFDTCFRDCIQRKTWCIGPYVGVDYNSPYLIANSVVGCVHPLYKGKGGQWGRSLLLVEHICICLLISKQPIGKGGLLRSGREGVRADLLFEHILWSLGNTMPELTLTPSRRSWL